jgi:hypothetical protein
MPRLEVKQCNTCPYKRFDLPMSCADAALYLCHDCPENEPRDPEPVLRLTRAPRTYPPDRPMPQWMSRHYADSRRIAGRA